MEVVRFHSPSLISASRNAYSGSDGNSARIDSEFEESSRARRLGCVDHHCSGVFSDHSGGYLKPNGWAGVMGGSWLVETVMVLVV